MIAENLRHECAIRVTCNGQIEFGAANAQSVTKVKITRESNRKLDDIGTYVKSGSETWNFSFYDYYAMNGITYTYWCTPYIGDRPLTSISAMVKSSFDNLFVGNLYEQYVGTLNLEYTHTTKFNRSYVQTYYSRYPQVVINGGDIDKGEQIYEIGSVSCAFMEFDKLACRFLPETSWEYKRKLRAFLASSSNKVIKTSHGDIWTVQINGEVTEASNKQGAMAALAFEWTEVEEPPTEGIVVITSLGEKKAVTSHD